MTQEIYWELLAWLFRSFLAVTAFAFVVAGYQTLRSRPRRGRSLSGFSRSEDHTGLRSDFFVVVDVWGVPSQVLLLESSGSNGADESAMRFARSLRWVPSREPRSGTMSIEWKEEEP